MHKQIIIFLLVVGFLAVAVSFLLRPGTSRVSQDSGAALPNAEQQAELQSITNTDTTSDISQDLDATASLDDVNAMLVNVDEDLQKL